MKKRDYFFCYNINVSKFMAEKGIEFITVSQDLKTKKIFSLYFIDEKFQAAMNEYRANKPK
ncbi:hypothetical protein [Peribacillus frigoritolerans]|uniref:hypothetical protein n=1 Tax=Peribacillus frigoritolerans TaxID=450367 RepID=UPI003B8B6015